MKVFWTVRRHVIAWVILACFASVYLWSLYQFPSLRHMSRSPAQVAAQPITQPAGQKPTSPLAGIVAKTEPAPNRAVTEFRSEIDALRRQLQELKEREIALRERVTAIESAFGPSTSALPPEGPPRITGALNEKKTLAAPVPKVTVTKSPLPDDGFGDMFIDVSPLPVAGVREPTKTLFGIELATADSPDALKKQWAELTDRHKPLLGTLEVRQEKATGKDETDRIRLIAGPFSNAAGAAQLCARLRAAGTSCKETVFGGDALPPP